jgi:hypothetical protein
MLYVRYESLTKVKRRYYIRAFDRKVSVKKGKGKAIPVTGHGGP